MKGFNRWFQLIVSFAGIVTAVQQNSQYPYQNYGGSWHQNRRVMHYQQQSHPQNNLANLHPNLAQRVNRPLGVPVPQLLQTAIPKRQQHFQGEPLAPKGNLAASNNTASSTQSKQLSIKPLNKTSDRRVFQLSKTFQISDPKLMETGGNGTTAPTPSKKLGSSRFTPYESSNKIESPSTPNETFDISVSYSYGASPPSSPKTTNQVSQVASTTYSNLSPSNQHPEIEEKIQKIHQGSYNNNNPNSEHILSFQQTSTPTDESKSKPTPHSKEITYVYSPNGSQFQGTSLLLRRRQRGNTGNRRGGIRIRRSTRTTRGIRLRDGELHKQSQQNIKSSKKSSAGEKSSSPRRKRSYPSSSLLSSNSQTSSFNSSANNNNPKTPVPISLVPSTKSKSKSKLLLQPLHTLSTVHSTTTTLSKPVESLLPLPSVSSLPQESKSKPKSNATDKKAISTSNPTGHDPHGSKFNSAPYAASAFIQLPGGRPRRGIPRGGRERRDTTRRFGGGSGDFRVKTQQGSTGVFQQGSRTSSSLLQTNSQSSRFRSNFNHAKTPSHYNKSASAFAQNSQSNSNGLSPNDSNISSSPAEKSFGMRSFDSRHPQFIPATEKKIDLSFKSIMDANNLKVVNPIVYTRYNAFDDLPTRPIRTTNNNLFLETNAFNNPTIDGDRFNRYQGDKDSYGQHRFSINGEFFNPPVWHPLDDNPGQPLIRVKPIPQEDNNNEYSGQKFQTPQQIDTPSYSQPRQPVQLVLPPPITRFTSEDTPKYQNTPLTRISFKSEDAPVSRVVEKTITFEEKVPTATVTRFVKKSPSFSETPAEPSKRFNIKSLRAFSKFSKSPSANFVKSKLIRKTVEAPANYSPPPADVIEVIEESPPAPVVTEIFEIQNPSTYQEISSDNFHENPDNSEVEIVEISPVRSKAPLIEKLIRRKTTPVPAPTPLTRLLKRKPSKVVTRTKVIEPLRRKLKPVVIAEQEPETEQVIVVEEEPKPKPSTRFSLDRLRTFSKHITKPTSANFIKNKIIRNRDPVTKTLEKSESRTGRLLKTTEEIQPVEIIEVDQDAPETEIVEQNPTVYQEEIHQAPLKLKTIKTTNNAHKSSESLFTETVRKSPVYTKSNSAPVKKSENGKKFYYARKNSEKDNLNYEFSKMENLGRSTSTKSKSKYSSNYKSTAEKENERQGRSFDFYVTADPYQPPEPQKQQKKRQDDLTTKLIKDTAEADESSDLRPLIIRVPEGMDLSRGQQITLPYSIVLETKKK